ncbi:chitobiase/beta-hexosaminidase C-terminal domain-containing protein [Vagococcus sp. BWB3-3]|uniref:Chitobiase/beta-hexosaminidase C-terminal domain-containing protein n=1 Tax=Vagococcus allomyrinae TaxID=2794353 RepID=A0A940PDP5_9ENTE|nr:FN3 associated domain-containing protein [Vagococcus allomyrinae]MBP1040913.1 chitobiase/beta-hexosaminidase C-terminal domain-containing protein [Vagococcus allomyrinae]
MKKVSLLLITIFVSGLFYAPTIFATDEVSSDNIAEISSDDQEGTEPFEEAPSENTEAIPIQTTSIETGNTFQIRKEISITTRNDDAETNYSSVNLTSTGLDLHGPTTYDTFLRFSNLNLPAGAILTNAYLIFTARNVSTSPTQFQIFGETSEATAFTYQGATFKNRQMSQNFVEVQTPAKVAVNDQLTTESLMAIFDEVSSQKAGLDDVVFKIVGSRSGSYIARSFESNPTFAPKLVLEYETEHDQTIVTTSVNSDDAEEFGIGLAVTTSSNLEIGGHYGVPSAGNKQQTGIRFNQVELPENAEIEDAYLEFVTATTTSRPATANMEIRAELGEPETYKGIAKNISNRSYSTLAIPFQQSNFTSRNTTIRTPNLSNIINETRLAGWQSGQSLAFKIDGDNFIGSVYSYGSTNPPRLVINYRYSDTPFTLTDVISDPQEIKEVFINEVAAEGSVASKAGWLELYNHHDQPVLLTPEIALTSKKKQSNLANLLIPANGFKVIYMDQQPDLGNDHGAFSLSGSGTVNLIDTSEPSMRTIDSLDYLKQKYNQTFGRKPDGSDQVTLINQPSFGQSNNQAKADQSLSFSHTRGLYSSSFQLELVTDPALTIRYTTDGSDPSETKGTIYQKPVAINQTTVVKAYAYSDDYNTGVTAQTYVFENNYPNEKISGYQWLYKGNITTEEYALGMKQFPIVSMTSNSTALTLLDSFGTFEYIDNHTENGKGDFFSLSANKKFGQVSAYQYNSGVAAKFNRNALTKKANYPFFEATPGEPYPVVNKFAKLELKEGQDGPQNDIYGLGYNRYDELVTNTLASQMGKIALSARYVNYFYNGKYMGIKTLREDFGEKMFEEYFGGNDSDYTKIRFQDGYFPYGIVEDGDLTVWPAIKKILATKDFQEAKKYIDVDDFIKTQILFMFVDTEREIDAVVENAVLEGKSDAVKMTFNINDTDGAFHNNNLIGTGFSALAGGGTYRYKWNIDSISRKGPGGLFGFFSGDSTIATAGNLEFKTLVKDEVLTQFGPVTSNLSQSTTPLSISNVTNQIQRNIDELKDAYKLDAAFMGARKTMYQDWLNQQVKILNQVPDRVQFSLDMWAKYQMAHSYKPVEISQAAAELKLTNPNPNTITYYTLDGSDPMGANGVIAPQAFVYKAETKLPEDAQLTIRAYSANNWGPLTKH